jgi:hypothetical protein
MSHIKLIKEVSKDGRYSFFRGDKDDLSPVSWLTDVSHAIWDRELIVASDEIRMKINKRDDDNGGSTYLI